MSINNDMIKQGQFLFRWRSFLPLTLLIPGAVAFVTNAEFITQHGEFVSEILVLIGVLTSLFGLAIRWSTVGFVPGGTSGRNTTEQRAHKLNTSGLYSISRNPLYVGNFFAILGVILSMKVWWLVAIFMLAYWLYIERIIATEEAFLTETFDKEYTTWANETPVFWPNFSKWQKPAMPFSPRTVLRREYNGLLGMAAAFFLTELFVDVVILDESLSMWLKEDHLWLDGLIIALVIFVILRTLKKHTNLLKVQGR